MGKQRRARARVTAEQHEYDSDQDQKILAFGRARGAYRLSIEATTETSSLVVQRGRGATNGSSHLVAGVGRLWTKGNKN